MINLAHKEECVSRLDNETTASRIKSKLTIFNESNDRAVLHGDIHVEVFNGDVEFTDAFFIFQASDVQLVSRFLKQCDIFGILGDSRSIFGNVSI